MELAASGAPAAPPAHALRPRQPESAGGPTADIDQQPGRSDSDPAQASAAAAAFEPSPRRPRRPGRPRPLIGSLRPRDCRAADREPSATAPKGDGGAGAPRPLPRAPRRSTSSGPAGQCLAHGRLAPVSRWPAPAPPPLRRRRRGSARSRRRELQGDRARQQQRRESGDQLDRRLSVLAYPSPSPRLRPDLQPRQPGSRRGIATRTATPSSRSTPALDAAKAAAPAAPSPRHRPRPAPPAPQPVPPLPPTTAPGRRGRSVPPPGPPAAGREPPRSTRPRRSLPPCGLRCWRSVAARRDRSQPRARAWCAQTRRSVTPLAPDAQ